MDTKYIDEIINSVFIDLNIDKIEDIDLLEICKHYNIVLEGKQLENTISGFYVVKNEISHIIYNSEESNKRIRFTIAHELGHYFLHKESPLFVSKKGGISNRIFHRDKNSSTGEILKEREANYFAASLLMPKNFIKYEVNLLNEYCFDDLITKIAMKFNVSEQAMTFRLANLGYTI